MPWWGNTNTNPQHQVFKVTEHNVLGWAIVIALCPASVVRHVSSTVALNEISSVITGRISTKPDELFLGRSTKIAQTVPFRCTKWPPEPKIENTSNYISSVTAGRISIKHDRIVQWEALYQYCSKSSALLHKMVASVKIKRRRRKEKKKKKKTKKKTKKKKKNNNFKWHLLGNLWIAFSQPTELFLGRSATKIKLLRSVHSAARRCNEITLFLTC